MIGSLSRIGRLGIFLAAALVPVSAWAATINGTVITTGTTTALAGASVVLSSSPAGGGARTPVDTVQTDAAGKFSFTAAVADNYGISVTHTGYLPYTNNNIDLAADTTVVDLAISLSVIPPPADISGTVVGADSVTAVAGATVVLTRPGTGGGGGARTPVDTLQTDAAGKFSFPDLAALENYGLTVTATGFQTYTNNNIDLRGTDTALTIRITPPPPPAAIGGTVVGADSVTAVAGATVVLTRPGTGGGARTPVDTLQTDAAGKFSFPDLAPLDNYGLTVTATGFETYTNNNIDLEGRDTSLTIRITPPPPPAAIGGTVVGADSVTAVAGATVVLTRPGTGGGARVPVDTLQTDAAGKFSFPALAPLDNYGLTVTATGFQTYTNNNIDLEGRDTSLTIRITPPPAPGTITGTVFATDSTTAVANATVILTRTGGGGGGGARIPIDTAQTDAQGKFTFSGVTPGDNLGLAINAAGFRLHIDNTVDLAAGATVTVNVRLAPPGAPGSIAGTVRTGGAAPTPIANATVILRSPALAGGVPLDTTQSNAEGQYSFSGVPSLDNYIVAVSAAGYQNATNNNVDVDSADTATVNFTMFATASIGDAASGPSFRLGWAGPSLALRVAPLAEARSLSVYGLTGAEKYRTVIPAYGREVLVPGSLLKEQGLTLVLTSRGKRLVFRVPHR